MGGARITQLQQSVSLEALLMQGLQPLPVGPVLVYCTLQEGGGGAANQVEWFDGLAL